MAGMRPIDHERVMMYTFDDTSIRRQHTLVTHDDILLTL
jgi:hypothetical protein